MSWQRSALFLLGLILVALIGGFWYQRLEGFSNNFTLTATGGKPSTVGELDSPTRNLLVADSYDPLPNDNTLSNNSAATIWWQYPVFKLGSYKQITNNIRYPNNPDDGTCMPASMCDALYQDDKDHPSNEITLLPPVNPECGGARVGYFHTDQNLLPFRSDGSNILY